MTSQKNFESVRHFYIAVLAFTTGVSVATFVLISFPTLVWLMLMAFVCALFWYRSTLFEEIVGWLSVSIILTFFVFGAMRMEYAESLFGHSELESQVGQVVEVEGVVSHEPDKREKTNRLFVRTDSDLILVTTDRYENISYGDEIMVTGKLKKPETFTTEFGRTFDYPGYLLAKGVEYQISFADVVVEDNGKGNYIISKLLHFKSAFMGKIEALIPEPAVGLGEGLLLGVKQSLGDELENAFRETGIIHIVVLSGYNIMLVVVFVMYILGHFLSVRPRVIVGIIAIVSFALLVGLSATVVRASIMAILLLVAQAFGRMYLVLRGLLVAGLMMILFNPYILVYDVGFQLSFLATLGLIMIAPHFETWFSKVPTVVGMRTFLVATIATQIAVLPLLLYQIGQFSVVAVLVNIIVLPMVPVAMLLTFITGMTAFVSANLAWLFSFPTYWSLTYINTIALWFADFSFAAFIVPAFPFYFVPVVYAVMGYLLYRVYNPDIPIGHGDMGEKLLQTISNKSNKETLAFADWTIVEEEEDDILQEEDNKKKQMTESSVSKQKTPIFFR